VVGCDDRGALPAVVGQVKDNPDLALTLLAEARESSGQALSELRTLVRGIHPPALVERGLDGAVRALALSLPLPVDVHSWNTTTAG
jgi:signal transduction histidine kinase